MIYKIVFWLLLVAIILFGIGMRGVYFDFMLTEAEKHEYIVKYLVIISILVIILFWLKAKHK
jgi:cytochrome bd-type quinol oxidase subunit 2